jgi:hypothetical protein
MTVNFFGVVRTTKAFLNLLKRSAQAAGPMPRILNMSSFFFFFLFRHAAGHVTRILNMLCTFVCVEQAHDFGAHSLHPH